MYSKTFLRTAFSGLFVLLIFACSPALFVPTIENSDKSGVPLERLQLGRKVYASHCGSCHSLYLPKQYNAKKWEEILNEMQEKSGITDAEKIAVLKYLTSQ